MSAKEETNQEVIKKYKEHFPSISPLVVACEKGNLEDVKVLIREYDVNELGKDTDDDNVTPLMAAVVGEHFDIVEYLIKSKKTSSIKQKETPKYKMHLTMVSNLVLMKLSTDLHHLWHCTFSINALCCLHSVRY